MSAPEDERRDPLDATAAPAGTAAPDTPAAATPAGTSRRDYLRLVATASGGLAVGAAVVAAGVLPRHGDGGADPLKVADQLGPGDTITFDYPTAKDRAFGVRLGDGTLAGYSGVCTHLACGLLWRPDQGIAGELHCPCHGGAFDIRTGAVTAGPPPRGLPKVVLVEDPAGAIWAIGTARSGESEEQGVCRELRDRDPELARQAGCDGPTSAPSTPVKEQT
ncbi:Rieske (2Fe-2S) protein [Kitasatospora sp. NBC_01287]|uniref:Rieske (2Fe-2S) protein n=1 Tax=Kitasatospora sp. NBC_01287 TaxID=2903573 RepID=UPI00225BA8B8|nr:Rieske (2Fe-2S) protein [Kitasatospora sp. NBC_01287]MCX4748837.1 Rieske (2Fe-2S) protein [Kitasatospora sp. NBC_01287]